MDAESDSQTPKILIAVQDDAARARLAGLLRDADVEVEVLDPARDPLSHPPETGADLVLVRRSEVDDRNVRLVDSYTSDEDTPGLVVFAEEVDGSGRAQLLAAGASSVLEPTDSNRELRENLEAIAEAESQGIPRGPHVNGVEPRPTFADFLSRSPRMQSFLALVQQVLNTDSSLLITGETGVGKERLAEAIHNEGHRRTGPFVSVNCGAIPDQLLESEIFGHEAGAFTGAAARRRGRFELADGGTIFLDEIGEMPAHLQVKLLTVLQSRKVMRVGGETPRKVDVRVMAATNRDVEEAVRDGRFREDLYYRLNVVGLEIPSLRDRPEDIPDLAGSFIRHFRGQLGRRHVEGLTDEALDAMMGYGWPGNVRELVNAMEHAVVVCNAPRIDVHDLPDRVVAGGETTAPGSTVPRPSRAMRSVDIGLPLKEAKRAATLAFERRYLEESLRLHRGSIGRTAQAAGLAPRSLYDKMKRHGLRKEQFKGG